MEDRRIGKNGKSLQECNTISRLCRSSWKASFSPSKSSKCHSNYLRRQVMIWDALHAVYMVDVIKSYDKDFVNKELRWQTLTGKGVKVCPEKADILHPAEWSFRPNIPHLWKIRKWRIRHLFFTILEIQKQAHASCGAGSKIVRPPISYWILGIYAYLQWSYASTAP